MKQIFKKKKKNSEVRHSVFGVVPAGAVAAADSDVKKKMRRLDMMGCEIVMPIVDVVTVSYY